MTPTPVPASAERIGVVEKIGYGLGDFASNLSFGFVSLFMLFFFTNVYGISATDAALIFAIARVADGIYNLFIGYIIDLTHSRWGKMRPFILFAAVPLGILTVLCFTKVTDSETSKFLYALLSYTAYCFAYTTVNTPYSGLNNCITQDAASRGSLSAYRLAFAYIGYLCVSTSANVIIAQFASTEEGYFCAATIFAILATLLFFACFGLTHERVHYELSAEERKVTWDDIKKSIFCNGPLIQLSLFTIFFYIVYTLWMAIAVYYVTYVMEDEGFIVTFFAIQSAAAIVSAIIADPLVQKYDKKPSTYLALALGVVACVLQYFIDPHNTIMVMVCVAGITAAMSIGFVTMWAMVADTVEYAQYQHQVRKEGLIYGFFNFITKVAMAIGGAMAGIALELTHYDASNVTAEAVLGINFLMTIVCAVLFALSALFIYFYAIDRTKYQEIIAALQARSLH